MKYFLGESSETQSHQCAVAWIIRQRERVKLRSWLTGSRLTWHRPETRFERSNRILAPQLRGYVRRKVRQPGGESRTTRQNCTESGGGRGREGGRGGTRKVEENVLGQTRFQKIDAATYRRHYIRCLRGFFLCFRCSTRKIVQDRHNAGNCQRNYGTVSIDLFCFKVEFKARNISPDYFRKIIWNVAQRFFPFEHFYISSFFIFGRNNFF